MPEKLVSQSKEAGSASFEACSKVKETVEDVISTGIKKGSHEAMEGKDK